MKWLASVVVFGFLSCGIFAAPGRPCTKHEDCSGLKNGYCSRAEICTRECSETNTCPDGTTCSKQGTRSVCLPSCDGDTPCANKGFTCAVDVCVLVQD